MTGKRSNPRSRVAGTTLLELLTVLTVVFTLVGVGVWSLGGFGLTAARRTAERAVLAELGRARIVAIEARERTAFAMVSTNDDGNGGVTGSYYAVFAERDRDWVSLTGWRRLPEGLQFVSGDPELPTVMDTPAGGWLEVELPGAAGGIGQVPWFGFDGLGQLSHPGPGSGLGGKRLALGLEAEDGADPSVLVVERRTGRARFVGD